MKYRPVKSSLCLAALLVLSLGSEAATLHDLTATTNPLSGMFDRLPAVVDLYTGDQVDLHVSFSSQITFSSSPTGYVVTAGLLAGNQPGPVTSPNFGYFDLSEVTFSFRDITGTGAQVPSFAHSGISHIGAQWVFKPTSAQPLATSGFDMHFKVDGFLKTDGVTPLDMVRFDSVLFGITSAVPEPADTVMFTLGLALLGWLGRRARRVAGHVPTSTPGHCPTLA